MWVKQQESIQQTGREAVAINRQSKMGDEGEEEEDEGEADVAAGYLSLSRCPALAPPLVPHHPALMT